MGQLIVSRLDSSHSKLSPGLLFNFRSGMAKILDYGKGSSNQETVPGTFEGFKPIKYMGYADQRKLLCQAHHFLPSMRVYVGLQHAAACYSHYSRSSRCYISGRYQT